MNVGSWNSDTMTNTNCDLQLKQLSDVDNRCEENNVFHTVVVGMFFLWKPSVTRCN